MQPDVETCGWGDEVGITKARDEARRRAAVYRLWWAAKAAWHVNDGAFMVQDLSRAGRTGEAAMCRHSPGP